jgi:hypothetical protein
MSVHVRVLSLSFSLPLKNDNRERANASASPKSSTLTSNATPTHSLQLTTASVGQKASEQQPGGYFNNTVESLRIRLPGENRETTTLIKCETWRHRKSGFP